MSNETDLTSANDIYLASYVDSMVLEERRPYNVMRPLFATFLGPQASNKADFPKITDPGAAGVFGIEDNSDTDGANTELATEEVTATLGTVGMMTTITDELRQAAIPDVYALFGSVLLRSVEEKFQTDATALLDDFSNTTGTAGVATTYATLLEAVGQLEGRDVTGTAVGVLDPAQWNDVVNDLGTSGAAAIGNPSFDVSALGMSLNSSKGSLAGADWFITSLVTSTGGAVFAKERGLAAYSGWGQRAETERDASIPGTEIVATERYGVVEYDDGSGETILI